LLCKVLSAHAIILWSTGDPTVNTTAPTGPLAQSGWEYQGKWGEFLGTAIAPHYFITAKHVGGAVGQSFSYHESSYTTTGYFDNEQNDLRIWQIEGAFPSYAELYSSGDEIGKRLVVFGRGTQRGKEVWMDTNALAIVGASSPPLNQLEILQCGGEARTGLAQFLRLKRAQTRASDESPNASGANGAGSSVIVNTASPATLSVQNQADLLRGWQAGPGDGVQRWGENEIAGILSFGGALGDLMVASFDAGAGPNEAHLSVGDSGGAVFIQESGIWKLAGINYGIAGPYRTTLNGESFNAAIFDEGGLYRGNTWIPDTAQNKPGSFYITRISSILEWIYSIIVDAR
jgi:hypothetical protein